MVCLVWGMGVTFCFFPRTWVSKTRLEPAFDTFLLHMFWTLVAENDNTPLGPSECDPSGPLWPWYLTSNFSLVPVVDTGTQMVSDLLRSNLQLFVCWWEEILVQSRPHRFLKIASLFILCGGKNGHFMTHLWRSESSSLGFGSLLPPCGSRGLNSSHLAGNQAHLPTRPLYLEFWMWFFSWTVWSCLNARWWQQQQQQPQLLARAAFTSTQLLL